jgi:bifunctional non-homologous end joining protein LigD
LKLDGYRIQAHLHEGRVTLYTRSGLNWTKRFPPIAADMAHLAPVSEAAPFTTKLEKLPKTRVNGSA